MKEKVSASVSALIVILYWTVTRCHMGTFVTTCKSEFVLARIRVSLPLPLFLSLSLSFDEKE